jgi:hypothetical protein
MRLYSRAAKGPSNRKETIIRSEQGRPIGVQLDVQTSSAVAVPIPFLPNPAVPTVPWVTRRTVYDLYCDWSGSASFYGSSAPAHTFYLGGDLVGHKPMTAGGFVNFFASGFGNYELPAEAWGSVPF